MKRVRERTTTRRHILFQGMGQRRGYHGVSTFVAS
jgi:hypothetical protein